MKRERNEKMIAIIALIVAIFGLTIGFAAFSNTLTISSTATVRPDSSTFSVDFSTSSTSVVTSSFIVPITVGGAVGSNATIDNGDVSRKPILKNIFATFTVPGQKVRYDFYAYNSGEYEAYLDAVEFLPVTVGGNSKACRVDTVEAPAASDTYLQSACSAVTMKVIVGEKTFTETNKNINDISLMPKDAVNVSVVLEYADDGARADGNFDVDFGDVMLIFKSA